jgi:DNA-binding Lrp family transcriptional regulator
MIQDLDVHILRTLDAMRNAPDPIKATAEALGLTQGRIRHRLFLARTRVEDLIRSVIP